MLFEGVLRLYLTGIMTINELKKKPRGDYRLKSVADSFHDAGYEFRLGIN